MVVSSKRCSAAVVSICTGERNIRSECAPREGHSSRQQGRPQNSMTLLLQVCLRGKSYRQHNLNAPVLQIFFSSNTTPRRKVRE